MREPSRNQQIKMFEMSKEQLRLERLAAARVEELRAATYTEDTKRISQAQELAVEAFRDQLDGLVAQQLYGLAVVRPR
jgi:hypothetical protein